MRTCAVCEDERSLRGPWRFVIFLDPGAERDRIPIRDYDFYVCRDCFEAIEGVGILPCDPEVVGGP